MGILKKIMLPMIMLLAISAFSQDEDLWFRTTVSNMCLELKSVGADGEIVDGLTLETRIENLMLNYLGISREKDSSTYKQRISEFWNENEGKFICRIEDQQFRTRTPQHFTKRVVAYGLTESIFDEFLLYGREEYDININYIEIYNGNKETLLDYVLNILNDEEKVKNYNKNYLISVKVGLRKYGAMTAKEIEEMEVKKANE